MKISIIIPTYNEEGRIVKLLDYLQQHAGTENYEIIVVDGQSTDHTAKKVREAGFPCLVSSKKGRAAQMNAGAEYTDGEILYFVHADTIPPKTFIQDIHNAISKGYESGCYRFAMNSNKWLLKINSWFTRFNRLICRGGDQTLFVKREVFQKLDGFKDYEIMEDFELIRRLRYRNTFTVMQKDVIVSDRKYQNNNYLKVNLINLVIFTMFICGASHETMVHAYRNLIHETRF